MSGAAAVAFSQYFNFTVQDPLVSFTERIQSLPAADRPIGARLHSQRVPVCSRYLPGYATDAADVTLVTGALDIGRRHASHSFDDDYVQNLRHLLFLQVTSPATRPL